MGADLRAVVNKTYDLDIAALLYTIEAEMKDAPDRLQWPMNNCSAQIGIDHPEHRARAIVTASAWRY